MAMRPHNFLESTTESLRVHLTTPHYEIEGTIYLSRSMKESRRLTNLLNGDKRFLALTDVTLVPRDSIKKETYPFIQVNIATIELVRPLSGEPDPLPDEHH